MTSATVGADTFDYKYAGTSQVDVLKQQIPFNDLKVSYGRTDQHGNPVIEQTHFDTLTAYIDNDPVTGQPLLLRTSTGGVSLYVYSGTGNPIANLSANGGTSGRWYDPTTGRWTRQDTLDAPLDPANANRYAYAGCDPINNTDPTGLFLTEAECAYLPGASIAFAGVSLATFVVAPGVSLVSGIVSISLAVLTELGCD